MGYYASELGLEPGETFLAAVAPGTSFAAGALRGKVVERREGSVFVEVDRSREKSFTAIDENGEEVRVSIRSGSRRENWCLETPVRVLTEEELATLTAPTESGAERSTNEEGTMAGKKKGGKKAKKEAANTITMLEAKSPSTKEQTELHEGYMEAKNQSNRARAYRAIVNHGPLEAKDVASRTGLTIAQSRGNILDFERLGLIKIYERKEEASSTAAA